MKLDCRPVPPIGYNAGMENAPDKPRDRTVLTFWALLVSWFAFLAMMGCQAVSYTRELARYKFQIYECQQKIDELNRQLQQSN